MPIPKLWILLHLLSAFSFVGSIMVAEWIGRAARATNDWPQRALLFQFAAKACRGAGLIPLILTGVLGNLASVGLGYRMATDVWLRWSNGLWLAAVLITALVQLPAVYRLMQLARAATGTAEPAGYSATMARWRLSNVLLSATYLAMLAFMVYGKRS